MPLFESPLRVLLILDEHEATPGRESWNAGTDEVGLQIVRATLQHLASQPFAQPCFDVLLLGPDHSLADCLHLLRNAMVDGCDAPIVTLIDGDDEALGIAALRAGAADYLFAQEVTPRQLLRTLRSAVERRQYCLRSKWMLQAVAAEARGLFWDAVVQDVGAEKLSWQVRLSDEAAAQRFLPLDTAGYRSYAAAWYQSRLEPDREESDHYGNTQVRLGLSYRQEFRCRDRNGITRWLVEDVQVETLAPGCWRAVGICTDITDIREAERARREADELLRAVSEGIPDAVYVKDREGHYRLINTAGARFLGKTVTEVLGRDDDELLAPESLQQVFSTDQHVMASRETGTHEERVTAAGITRTYLTTKGPLYDEQGQVIGLLGISRDISKAKAIEEALRASEAQHRFQSQLLNAIGEAVVAWDREGTVTYWNCAAERLYGWGHAEFLTLKLDSLVPEVHRDQLAVAKAQLWAQGHWSGELTLQRKDETAFPALVTLSVLRFADGDPENWVGVFTDITKRKRSEAALHESEAHIRRLLETAQEGIIQLDKESRLTYVNGRMCELLGYAGDELVGASLFDFIHPVDHPAVRRGKTRREGGQQDSYEVRLLRRDGSVLHSILSCSPILNSCGEYAGVLGMLSDLTAWKQAEAALREREEHLRLLLEQVPCVLWSTDTKLQFTLGGGTVLAELGLGEHQDANLSLVELFGTDDPHFPPIGAHLRALQGERSSFELESRGKVFQTCVEPLRAIDGSIMGASGVALDVTALKQHEAELAEAARRVTTILESITDAFFAVDREWRFTYVNQEAERLLRRSRTELIGENLWSEFSEAIPLPFYAEYHRALQESVPVHFEEFYPPLSIWVEVHTYPTPEGLAVYFRDVTQRRAAQEALRASEERFRSFFAQAAVGVAVFDLQGRPVEANPALERLLGYSVTELRQMTLPALTHTEGQRQNWEFFQELVAGKRRQYELETRFVRKDGQIIWGRLIGSVMEGPDGTPLLISGLLEDLTRRKQAEAERDRLFECSLDMFCVADLGGYLKRINPAFARTLGYTEADLVARNFLELVHPDDLAATQTELTKLATGLPTLYFENRCRSKDGDYRWLAWNTFPDVEQSLTYAVARDMTPLKEAEASFQQVQEQLHQAQKMEAIGRLAGGVAHDFNNMLSVINGYSELLLMRLPSDSQWRELIEQIHLAGCRSSDLTRQLLVFSRNQLLQPRILDLNQTLRGAEKLLRRLIGEDIEMMTVTDPTLGMIQADPGQMEQVLLNLAVNARDAMPMGGKLLILTGNVELNASRARQVGVCPGSYILLQVQDTGSGIAPEVLPHIFEPFFTTKGVGEGTGLGLATAYGIVKQSGGVIEVGSIPGEGTTFAIYLPRIAEHCTLSFELPPTDCPSGSETILLVEDEPQVRAMVRNLLADYGYGVLEAPNGEDALRLAASHAGKIDLLLTDVVMPRMSGHELAEQVRRLWPETQVLFMTGYTDDAMVRYGLADAKIALLQKPFTPLTLAQQIRRVLDTTARRATAAEPSLLS